MAIEKQLNTRIQLKYDSLSNWNEHSGVVLKKGEIALCAVPTGGSAIAGDLNRPQVLFKVGDGTSTFANLPWASALAADVHAWAKQANLPVVKEGDGNVVTSISWDAENKAIKYTTDKMATATEFADLAKDLEELTTKVNGMYTSAKIDELVADAKKAGTDAASALATYKTSNDQAVADAKKAGTDAAAALETYKGTNDQAVATINTNITNIVNGTTPVAKATQATNDGNGNNIAATYQTIEDATEQHTKMSGKIEDLEEAVEAINGAENGILAQAKAYTDEKDQAMDARVDALEAIKHETFALKAEVVSNTTFSEFQTANTQAIADAEQAAKDYTDSVKDALLGEGIKDTFDTLVEIQNWIEGDGVNATELTEAIAAEAKTRGEEITRVEGLISAEKTRAEGIEEGLAERIGKIESGTTIAKKAESAEKDADGNVITDTYETKTDATAKLTEAKGYTDTAKAAAIKHADDAVSALRTEMQGADNDIKDRLDALEDDFSNGIANEAAKVSNALTVTMEDSTVKTFDGSAAVAIDLTNLATKAYADQAETDAIASANGYTDGKISTLKTSLEQADADLDGRVTTLETNHIKTITAGDGLKVTPGTNSATIAFDDECVFIINCGSSTELV